MIPPPPTSVRRRGLAATIALVCGLVALLASGRDARASTAATGQIIWSASNGIWAMDDNGADPHELISAASPSLAARLPSGTVSSPDVFQNDGTAVLFTGLTSAYATPGLPAACGADCSATFELHNGTLSELGPPATAASGAAYYESQPRITADGQELFDSSLTTGILQTSPGTPATALVERPLAQNAVATQWSNTNAESEPAAGFDGAPDPADATQAAWVQSQGCAYQYPNAQGVAQSSCQYAVHFGTASQTSAPVLIYDNEFVGDNGRGPTSLSLSTDGSTLLLVDPSAPNTGIYTTPVAGVPGLKPVTELLAQPVGWTFGQARFAGSKIVFDAHQVSGSAATGDIYTIPADCAVASGCTFPASATDLTNDASADNSDPAWTSATAPLQSLHVGGLARITGASAPSAAVVRGRSFTLAVTLSAAATIAVRIARRAGTPPKYRTVGSLTLAGRRGINRVTIRLVAGRTLPAGSYTATVALRGAASTATRTLHFSVRN